MHMSPKSVIRVSKEDIKKANKYITKPDQCPIWEGAVRAGWEVDGVYYDHIVLKHPDKDYARAYLFPPSLTRWQKGGPFKRRKPIKFDLRKFPSHEVRS